MALGRGTVVELDEMRPVAAGTRLGAGSPGHRSGPHAVAFEREPDRPRRCGDGRSAGGGRPTGRWPSARRSGRTPGRARSRSDRRRGRGGSSAARGRGSPRGSSSTGPPRCREAAGPSRGSDGDDDVGRLDLAVPSWPSIATRPRPSMRRSRAGSCAGSLEGRDVAGVVRFLRLRGPIDHVVAPGGRSGPAYRPPSRWWRDAELRSAFDGTQPMWGHDPPNQSRSAMRTLAPRSRASWAAASPAGPAPMITKSNSIHGVAHLPAPDVRVYGARAGGPVAARRES